jgi:hypothetical protein
MASSVHCAKNSGKTGRVALMVEGKTCDPGAHSSGKGPIQVKTVIIIVAELVRSLVISGLGAAGFALLLVAGLAGGGLGLWRLWRRTRG